MPGSMPARPTSSIGIRRARKPFAGLGRIPQVPVRERCSQPYQSPQFAFDSLVVFHVGSIKDLKSMLSSARVDPRGIVPRR